MQGVGFWIIVNNYMNKLLHVNRTEHEINATPIHVWLIQLNAQQCSVTLEAKQATNNNDTSLSTQMKTVKSKTVLVNRRQQDKREEDPK